MSEGTPFAAEKQHAKLIACGRTFEEQAADIAAYGNHGASPVLRASVLMAHGITKPRETAPNGIIFGCYRPFSTPFLVRDYLRILDLLQVEYTFFDREYCCGLPLIMDEPQIAISEKVAALATDAQARNLEIARTKGVETLAYCCLGCAYVARHFAEEKAERHVYILDLILDAMEKRSNKISPQTIGYFEGCHSYYQAYFPGVTLNWPRYRGMLDKIEGLNVVDIPRNICCKRGVSQIIEKAIDLKLDTILCSCNGCYLALKKAAPKNMRVINMADLLLECLQ